MERTRTLIALARLLEYPAADVREHMPEILEALRELEPGGTGDPLESPRSLGEHLAGADLLDVQAEYVETFDRGRSTSLNLYEHLHGEARGRGPAMAELAARYEQAGLHLTARQLPDFLPAFLEYASTLSDSGADEALRPFTTALIKIATALERRKSPWLAAIVAVLRCAGVHPWRSAAEQPPVAPAQATSPDWSPDALDAAWIEQPIEFLGAADPGGLASHGRGSSTTGARTWR